MFSVPPRGVLLVLVAVLIAAAIYDVRYRRIPNWICVTGVLLGLLVNVLIGPPEGGAVFALTGLALAFGVYLFLYLLRAMGAGDVKLMAAVGSMVGYERWFGLFIVTAIIGGTMALVLIVVRGRAKKTLWNVGFILSELRYGRPAYLGKEELDVRTRKGLGLPHGAVIALGTIFYIALAARLSR